MDSALDAHARGRGFESQARLHSNFLEQEINSTLLNRVLPDSLKGWGVYYHVYVIGAHKRTCVDRRNMPNHHTST